MFESWLYPNVPIENEKVLIYKLPSEYSMMNVVPMMDCHVVHESEKTNRYRNGNSTALCGTVTRRETHRRVDVNGTCDVCMGQLNKKLQGAMYDEHNDELYLPV